MSRRHKPDYEEIARLERELDIAQPEPTTVTPGEPAIGALHNLIVEPDGVIRMKTPAERWTITSRPMSSYGFAPGERWVVDNPQAVFMADPFPLKRDIERTLLFGANGKPLV